MIDFLIMYEVRVRELESIILLGTELINRGYTVEYLSFDDVDHNRYVKNRKKLKKYYNNVKVVLMPSLYHNNEIYNTVYYVCGNAQKIVNIRWEQYFANIVMDDSTSYLFPHEDAVKAYHMCWGQRSYDSLVACGVKSDKLILSGALHLDFLRPEFNDFYENKEKLFEQYGFDSSKKTILYMSSFAIATRTKRLETAVQKDFNNNYNEDDRIYSFHRQSYLKTLEWIDKFLEVNKNVIFVYRPHPAENVTDEIEDISRKYKNFYIISDYSVKQWIISCDIVTTWVSTSIVEAYYANKPCFIVRPLEYPYDIDMSVYQGAKFIDNQGDFMKIIDKECRNSVSDDIMHSYYQVDDIPAYIKFANELVEIINNDQCFEWNDHLMKQFDIKRRKLYIRNLFYYVYIGILRLCDISSLKLGFKFGKSIDDRVENYRARKKKALYDTYNNNSFKEIEIRIHNVLSRKVVDNDKV